MKTLSPASLVWGDRFAPLPRKLTYVFSMDIPFDVEGQHYARGAGRVKMVLHSASHPSTPPEKLGFTYHVQDEVLIRTPDGIVRDVPVGTLERADHHVHVDGGSTGSVDGRALLVAEGGGRVAIEYTGVVELNGEILDDFARPRKDPLPIERGAYLSLRSECDRPRFRWMVENQLFAFGRVRLLDVTQHDEEHDTWYGSLAFSYDVYVAAGA